MRGEDFSRNKMGREEIRLYKGLHKIYKEIIIQVIEMISQIF